MLHLRGVLAPISKGESYNNKRTQGPQGSNAYRRRVVEQLPQEVGSHREIGGSEEYPADDDQYECGD